VSRITLPILDAVTLTAACTQIVADARTAFDLLATLPLADVSPSTVLNEWDRIGVLVENIEGPVSILNNVHPDKAVRDAADEAIRQLASFQVEVFQNEALYARVQAVVPTSPAETQLRKDLVESFDDTGVTLPPDRRARARSSCAQPLQGAPDQRREVGLALLPRPANRAFGLGLAIA